MKREEKKVKMIFSKNDDDERTRYGGYSLTHKI